MGRPKRPFNGVEDIEWSQDKYLRSQHPGGLKVRQERRWDASTYWAYRAVNGLYDPLTYLFVVDVLANINPDIELRTKNLVEFLNRHRPQFRWDTTTVGRVLADICESYEDVLGQKNGMLEQGTDYRGNFYRIHHNPETTRVFYALREDLMKLADLEITKRARGERTSELVSPLRDCPSVRVGFDLGDEPVAASA